MDALAALRSIADAGEAFLSRDDRLSARRKEQELWAAAGIEPDDTPWYRSADLTRSGSTAVARKATRLGAYTLLERATYADARSPLASISEGDPRLLSVLSAIPVNPRRVADVNEGEAEAFVEWLLADAAQALVGVFRLPEHRSPRFSRRNQIPNIELH